MISFAQYIYVYTYIHICFYICAHTYTHLHAHFWKDTIKLLMVTNGGEAAKAK